MSRLSETHEELIDGVGKCSVPMWVYPGIPAGFCDELAYGRPPKCEMYRDRSGKLRRIDNRYDGHVPGLACPGHGGPSEKVESARDREDKSEAFKRVETEN